MNSLHPRRALGWVMSLVAPDRHSRCHVKPYYFTRLSPGVLAGIVGASALGLRAGTGGGPPARQKEERAWRGQAPPVATVSSRNHDLLWNGNSTQKLGRVAPPVLIFAKEPASSCDALYTQHNVCTLPDISDESAPPTLSLWGDQPIIAMWKWLPYCMLVISTMFIRPYWS